MLAAATAYQDVTPVTSTWWPVCFQTGHRLARQCWVLYAGYPNTVVSACEGDEGAMMSEQPTDRTAETEEATKPGDRDQWYGHLTVEDDPEGTTDEAELLRRYTSHDEA